MSTKFSQLHMKTVCILSLTNCFFDNFFSLHEKRHQHCHRMLFIPETHFTPTPLRKIPIGITINLFNNICSDSDKNLFHIFECRLRSSINECIQQTYLSRSQGDQESIPPIDLTLVRHFPSFAVDSVKFFTIGKTGINLISQKTRKHKIQRQNVLKIPVLM